MSKEAVPFLADPMAPGQQFPGWPVTVDVQDNYRLSNGQSLPKLVVEGISDPVVQLISEDNGEVIYTLRIRGNRFQPRVPAPGNYRVIFSEPESGKEKQVSGLDTASSDFEEIVIRL